MAEYADIEKLKTQLHGYQLDNCNNCTDIDCGLCFHFILDDAPAADVALVVHGRWEEIRNAYGELEGWLCKCGRESNCKEKYCPNCGAKMDLRRGR